LSPETSLGFAVVDFAVLIRRPLDPWQRWLVIHAMELLPNGWPAVPSGAGPGREAERQDRAAGDLEPSFGCGCRTCFAGASTSTKLDYARISWKKAIQLARRTPELRANMRVRRENGKGGVGRRSRPGERGRGDDKIAASNEEGAALSRSTGWSRTRSASITTTRRTRRPRTTLNAVDDAAGVGDQQ
jgi:hypothetical protein